MRRPTEELRAESAPPAAADPGVRGSTRTSAADPPTLPAVTRADGDDARSELRTAWCYLAAPVAIGLAIAAFTGADRATPTQIVGAILVVLWAAAGVALGARRRHDRSSPIVLVGACVGGVLCLAQVIDANATMNPTWNDTAAVALRMSATVLPAVALHLLGSLPDGRLGTSARRRAIAAGYVVACGTGLALCIDLERMPRNLIVLLWCAAVGAGTYLASLRYRACGAMDRRRMQWIAWGVAVAVVVALVTLSLRLLTGWPDSLGTVALAATALIPIAVIAGTAPRLVNHVDRLLTQTVELGGLTALILAIYVAVVLGLGHTPDGGERSLLLLSMLAAGLAALLFVPARSWLAERANRLVYGARVAPDETLRTFAHRLTRSIPMEELMLQLAENLRSSMVLTSAEVWTGGDGHYERLAGVPHRSPGPVQIGETERAVVARAGVSGGTWLEIWVPQLVGPAGSAATRVAPIAHAGMLLGFIVVTRASDGDSFNETEDTVLTDIARQIGLALHNAQLDTALQASLDQLRIRNEELQQSRARIVSAGDAERRKLERNLHDGAQQHLVALAVKLRLAADAVDDDPEDAVAMIDEVKSDVQTAIAELRALAHGIFPPLLVSGGLSEALPAAAGRAALPTTVDVDGVGRYGNDIEATVYFCTLEALQNAGKHAGEEASAVVSVAEVDGVLRFEVCDDGAGFEIGSEAGGHGFVNMADRLGAIGGDISVSSTLGEGTSIIGTIPLGRSRTQPPSDA